MEGNAVTQWRVVEGMEGYSLMGRNIYKTRNHISGERKCPRF